MAEHVVGLDLGQSIDYTALIVGEIHRTPAYGVDVSYIQRFKLGTSYPAIVAAVVELMQKPPLTADTALVVDATGVGRAIVDMIAQSGQPLVPVSIHAGEEAFWADGYWRVPKRDLMAVVQSLLQTGRLGVSTHLPEAETLTRELLNFTVKVTDQGRATFSARVGEHDDLVLAVALACYHGLNSGSIDGASAVGEARPMFGGARDLGGILDYLNTRADRYWGR